MPMEAASACSSTSPPRSSDKSDFQTANSFFLALWVAIRCDKRQRWLEKAIIICEAGRVKQQNKEGPPTMAGPLGFR